MALIVYQRLSMPCQTWLRYAEKALKKWLSWLMETVFLYMALKVMLFFSYKSEMNRQDSYSPTVLDRVGLDHECEAHAGTFSPRGQTNMKKLRLFLPNLWKILTL